VACRVLDTSRSGFYDWLGRPEPPRELRNNEVLKLITEIHAESRGSYGSPRVHAELRLGLGLEVNRKRVERLMREAGLQGIYRRRGRRNLVKAATEEDLVRRQFTTVAPDVLWLTDITEHPAGDGKLYCAAVMDAWSRRIIGWSMNKRQDTNLVVGALAMAVTRRQPDGDSTILHSDHGAQGGFNRSSQHLDHGGVRWDEGRRRCRLRRGVLGGSGRRIGRCGGRCVHRAGRSRLVRCSGSSGG
jgi:putative transposase